MNLQSLQPCGLRLLLHIFPVTICSRQFFFTSAHTAVVSTDEIRMDCENSFGLFFSFFWHDLESKISMCLAEGNILNQVCQKSTFSKTTENTKNHSF